MTRAPLCERGDGARVEPSGEQGSDRNVGDQSAPDRFGEQVSEATRVRLALGREAPPAALGQRAICDAQPFAAEQALDA